MKIFGFLVGGSELSFYGFLLSKGSYRYMLTLASVFLGVACVSMLSVSLLVLCQLL